MKSSVCRVLIVDDSPEDREAVRVALRRNGEKRFQITEAVTGTDGLALLEGVDAFDLVILDYRLPDMNAEQFLNNVTEGGERVPDVPIVLLTGSLGKERRISDQMRSGIQDFFSKHEVTPQVLSRIADNAIQRHRLLLDLVASESKAEAARREAEQANRAKSQFLTLISHELRTPLTAIMGFADLLRENPAGDETGHMLKTISTSSRHLAELLDDLIDIAKIESGTLDIDTKPCNVRLLITKACDLMRVKAAEKGLKVTQNVDASIPKSLITDPVRLRQILLNLLGNSVKFTDSGRVHCEAIWDDKLRQLSLRVTDTGCGISPEVQKTLFKRFVQGEHNRDAGIGLGLAICKELAKMMDGDINVETTSPSGTTFLVTLTFAVSAAAESSPESSLRLGPVAPKRPAKTLKDRPSLAGKKLLIADDTSANRYLIGKLLEPTGADIEFAANGVEVLEKVAAGEFDLILMDMYMPEKDGFEATKEIRRRGGKMKIIAFTAAATSAEQALWHEAGCNDIVTKPIDVPRFFDLLAHNLDAE